MPSPPVGAVTPGSRIQLCPCQGDTAVGVDGCPRLETERTQGHPPRLCARGNAPAMGSLSSPVADLGHGVWLSRQETRLWPDVRPALELWH